MRLYNTYFLCKNYIDRIRELSWGKKEYNNTEEYDLRLNHWKDITSYLETLEKIDILKENVEAILKNKYSYDENKNALYMTLNIANEIKENHRVLISKMETIIALYESLNIKSTKDGVDIKIPECSSFKEYIQFVKDIDFVFCQCPLISQCDEEIVFNAVDVGSMWLTFFIKAEAGSHIILNALAKMSDIALKIRLNTLVIKQQEEILEMMRKRNEISAEIIDGFKKMKKVMLDEAVSELEQQCNVNISDPEDRDRAARSLETLAVLIDRGVEIYSSIDAPKETKDLFPFKEDMPIISEELQSLIGEKNKRNSM